MPKTTLIFIRHAETQWNREQRIQGFQDSPLSEIGRRQAERLGERLRKLKLASVYSSDAPRCLETAKIALQGTEVLIQTLIELRERNLGAWEGEVFTDIKGRDPEGVQAYYDNPAFEPPGGETWHCVQARVNRGIQKILSENESKKVGIFTSGGPIKAALLSIFEIPPEKWSAWRTSNTSVSILEKDKGRWRVNIFNDMSHWVKDE